MGTSGSEGGLGKPTSRKADRTPRPDPCTYVAAWSGTVYVAFVTNAYARRILGWSVAMTMTSQLAVDAVEQAIWTRGREGKDLAGLIAHHDHGVQYMSVAYSQRLDAAGIKPSTGAVGSSYDNALAESVIGLYKTELVKPRRPWKGPGDLEIATAEWVDWFNHHRPFEHCDDLTPIEAETAHYAHHQDPAPVGISNQKASGHAGRFTLRRPQRCPRLRHADPARHGHLRGVSTPDSTLLRTFDAVHLAAALELGDDMQSIVTNAERQSPQEPACRSRIRRCCSTNEARNARMFGMRRPDLVPLSLRRERGLDVSAAGGDATGAPVLCGRRRKPGASRGG